ncbi:hypothetical protein IHE44_0008339 [Lamprotornis superbus]|uniref:Uncharacterized protein n=1 Tax=Lamprotornis superbus TaxID=245042 RepID=A0A835NKE3_9PASS|nr:hypothetical protein IHE44_0008339 [Lamprotornis superbus]
MLPLAGWCRAPGRSFSFWALVSSTVLDRQEVLCAVPITVPGRWNGPTAASFPQREGLLEQLILMEVSPCCPCPCPPQGQLCVCEQNELKSLLCSGTWSCSSHERGSIQRCQWMGSCEGDSKLSLWVLPAAPGFQGFQLNTFTEANLKEQEVAHLASCMPR